MKIIFAFCLIVKLIIICLGNFIKYLFGYLNWDNMIKLNLLYLGNQNIIFLKLFQWLFINNNIYFNQNIIDYINTFTNNAPYSNEDIDWEIISNLLNLTNSTKNTLKFDSFVPINSGTISLVFKGTFNDNIVAIKILRKNIKNKLINGIDLFEKILSLISNLSFFHTYKIYDLFNTNKNDIILQTNFVNEVNNIIKFKNTFAKNKILLIPLVYQDITYQLKNVIVMDWIDGYSINQIESNDKLLISPIYLRFIFSSYIIKGLIHSDLHQGNIIFTKTTGFDNEKISWKIGLIDFGSITQADTEQINFISVFLSCIFESKLIEFIDYLNLNKNYIFESYDNKNLSNSFDHLILLNQNNQLFNLNSNSNIHMDILTFIKIFYIGQCYFKSKFHKLILTIIPQIYIYKNLCMGTNHKEIINNFHNKLFSKFLQ